MENEIPRGAMRFVETGPDCFAVVEQLAEDKPPKLKMVGYSGGLIKGHWYWGDLAIDLKGIEFPLSKYPVLEDHNTDLKIAFTGKPDVSNGKLELNPETSKFLDTEASRQFQKNSLAGFPYQSSIYARPSVVERLSDGEKAEVNGMTVRGPASIWRKAAFKECSACVFGWDGKTQASAFSKTEMEEVDIEYLDKGGESSLLSEEGKQTILKTINQGKEEKLMDVKELREKHPDLVVQLTEEVTNSVTETVTALVTTQLTEGFNAEKTALEAKLAAKDQTIDGQGTRLAQLEKNDTIRGANERQTLADRIWESKLSESALDAGMHEKIRAMITHTKFVKDDVLDETAFAEAVDAEIKDWEGRMKGSSIQGTGFTRKSGDGDPEETTLSAKNKEVSNGLLALAGQKPK